MCFSGWVCFLYHNRPVAQKIYSADVVGMTLKVNKIGMKSVVNTTRSDEYSAYSITKIDKYVKDLVTQHDDIYSKTNGLVPLTLPS